MPYTPKSFRGDLSPVDRRVGKTVAILCAAAFNRCEVCSGEAAQHPLALGSGHTHTMWYALIGRWAEPGEQKLPWSTSDTAHYQVTSLQIKSVKSTASSLPRLKTMMCKLAEKTTQRMRPGSATYRLAILHLPN